MDLMYYTIIAIGAITTAFSFISLISGDALEAVFYGLLTIGAMLVVIYFKISDIYDLIYKRKEK